MVQTIRASTRTGRPAGDEAFAARIEEFTRQPANPKQRKPGRKAKG